MHCRRLDGEPQVNCQVANTAALAGAELSGAENASGPGVGESRRRRERWCILESKTNMAQPPSTSAILKFDAYALDLRAGELFKNGKKIKIQEQPVQILAMLLERPGEVVTREELRERLWSEDTFVDFEHSLNTAIKKLRLALNDDSEKPRFIETLRRRGYRFAAALAESANAEAPPATAAAKPVAKAGTKGAANVAAQAATDLVGQVFALRSDSSAGKFVSLPTDETTLKEQQKLEAANDDLGLSLLFADGKVLMVQTGTQVKVLDAQSGSASYEVRILAGEHTAKTAIVPRKYLI
jgi:DNA-binding winged helix-turn-helix (wHTH) protein